MFSVQQSAHIRQVVREFSPNCGQPQYPLIDILPKKTGWQNWLTPNLYGYILRGKNPPN